MLLNLASLEQFISTIERDHACITISGSTINVISIVIFSLNCELGTNTDIRRSKVNTPKDKKKMRLPQNQKVRGASATRLN